MATTKEFREIHSIYQTLLEGGLKHSFPLPQVVEEMLDPKKSANESQPVPRAAEEWLELLDMAVTPHMMRSYFNERGAQDSSLRVLIRFIVSKKSHSQDDRDKVDWLATHLFKLREEQKRRPTSWPKTDVIEILEGFDFPMLSRYAEDLLMEMPALLDEVKFFEHFSQITDSRILQRARDLKNQFGDEFFQPDVLAAVVNYNLFFGNKFHSLMQDTLRQVHEFAQTGENRPPTTAQIMDSDYRLTADALRQLSEIGRKEVVVGATSPAGNLAGQGVPPEQQLRQLGVDVEQEVLYLRNRTEELTMRLRSNLNMTSVPNSFAPLMLSEWEAAAFRTLFPESEQSFRADFARGLCRAITLIYRIYEEIPHYLEKKGSEYLWKRHYDSLVYLLYEGRNQKEILGQLAGLSEKRGLPEKSRQLQSTVQKLDTALAKVAELF
ncbi:MAG: hypothetical protein HYX73_10075 [Acidobacteria bacterium]|nr:hypothetical protein [Acidobacteriota bacterium]